MNTYKDYAMELELNRIRNAEIIAEAAQNRLAWQLRKQNSKSWQQRLAPLLAAVKRMSAALRVHRHANPARIGDEADLTPDLGKR